MPNEQTQSDNSKVKTVGETRVGVDFNPSRNPLVDEIKRNSADLIDKIYDVGQQTAIPDVKRWAAEAATNIETGCMYAVKAIVNSKQ